jgi:hypothetical protein
MLYKNIKQIIYGGVIMNWLIRKCSKSNSFAWGVAIIGIIVMVVIYLL